VPEFDGVEEFCREDSGLVPMAVDSWGPLVFVHQSAACGLATNDTNPAAHAGRLANPVSPLATLLDPLMRRSQRLGLEKLQFVARKEYELGCNWKVFVDNYQDGGYHVNTVHPGLAGALDYSKYRTENEDWTSVQISPLKPSEDATVGLVRTGDNAYYWWLFPNLMINIYEGVMDTNLVLPLGPDRCRVIFDFYFANTEGEERRRFIEQSIAVAHQVQFEDMGVCDEVQRGLKSRTYDAGRFSVKRESGGYHFHQLLAKKLRED